MDYAEFEEKEYEAPLYRQLLGPSNRIATPGQVFEHVFGADACLEALSASFWNIMGYPQPPRGAKLNDFSWGWIWRVFGSRRRLPTFSVNLLIQSKRPDYLLGNKPSFARFGFSKNYWRFRIRKHQQEALTKLSQTLGARALVVYASPAFHTLEDLYDHTENGTIIENSTFPSAEWLENHKTWNYNEAGRKGIAASRPQKFHGSDFWPSVDALINEGGEPDAKKQFHLFFKTIEDVASDLEADNPIVHRYRHLISQEETWLEESDGPENPPSPDAAQFRNCLLFLRLVGVDWFIAGRPGGRALRPKRLFKV